MNFSVPRSIAFIAVTQDHVNWILEGPGPERYTREESFLVHTITNDAARDNIVQRLSLA
jgi:hypothetical protein